MSKQRESLFLKYAGQFYILTVRAIAHLNTFAHNYMLDFISLVRVFYRSLRTI